MVFMAAVSFQLSAVSLSGMPDYRGAAVWALAHPDLFESNDASVTGQRSTTVARRSQPQDERREHALHFRDGIRQRSIRRLVDQVQIESEEQVVLSLASGAHRDLQKAR